MYVHVPVCFCVHLQNWGYIFCITWSFLVAIEETNLVSNLRKERNFLAGCKIKETPRPWKNRTQETQLLLSRDNKYWIGQTSTVYRCPSFEIYSCIWDEQRIALNFSVTEIKLLPVQGNSLFQIITFNGQTTSQDFSFPPTFLTPSHNLWEQRKFVVASCQQGRTSGPCVTLQFFLAVV